MIAVIFATEWLTSRVGCFVEMAKQMEVNTEQVSQERLTRPVVALQEGSCLESLKIQRRAMIGALKGSLLHRGQLKLCQSGAYDTIPLLQEGRLGAGYVDCVTGMNGPIKLGTSGKRFAGL